jgi:transcriptional regulator with XRE-family HTH domain
MDLDSAAKRLRWARQQHSQYKTPTEAAKAFGWKASTYLGHENGDRNPSRDAAKRYARAYRVRWEWLLDNEGPAVAGRQVVQLIGYVDDGSKVIFYDVSNIEHISELPPHVGVNTVALEVRGGSMRGLADSGWLFFFDDERLPLDPKRNLFGKLCVVLLKNGDALVRVVQPGRKRGRFDLESPTLPTLRDQQVTWAARITWIKPR